MHAFYQLTGWHDPQMFSFVLTLIVINFVLVAAALACIWVLADWMDKP